MRCGWPTLQRRVATPSQGATLSCSTMSSRPSSRCLRWRGTSSCITGLRVSTCRGSYSAMSTSAGSRRSFRRINDGTTLHSTTSARSRPACKVAVVTTACSPSPRCVTTMCLHVLVSGSPHTSVESWHSDHVIVEAWVEGRWRRFDPEFAAPLPALADPTDIPISADGPFLTAAQVWCGHRAGVLDVARYGAVEYAALQGEPFVHAKVICELAHRFGDELLLWDRWGAMNPHQFDAPPHDIDLIDDIATLLVRADEGDTSAEHDLLARYRQDPRLRPGSFVYSISPTGERHYVDLTTRSTSRLS